MPIQSAKKIVERKSEILQACRILYEQMDFKDVTIQEIARQTSFSRPSIYNYFQTREEIFLALFEKEYDLWTEALDHIQPENTEDPAAELAEKTARTLENRQLMLRLLSTNLYEMETSSRMECLISFKKAYGRSIEALKQAVARFYPSISKKQLERIVFSFLPMIYGLYPYTHISQKQQEAMEKAGTDLNRYSVFELAAAGLQQLLKASAQNL